MFRPNLFFDNRLIRSRFLLYISTNESEVQDCHNNHFQNCHLSTTISTLFQLETRGWSQIQAEKEIFPDLAWFFLKIDLLEVVIYCTAKRVQKCNSVTTTISRIVFFQAPFLHFLSQKLAVGPRFKLRKTSFQTSHIFLKSNKFLLKYNASYVNDAHSTFENSHHVIPDKKIHFYKKFPIQ